MERLAGENGENFRISKRGYAYVTRTRDVDVFLNELQTTYGDIGAGEIRVHEKGGNLPRIGDGADVLIDRDAIQERFPHLSDDISILVLVRRAGDLNSQQLGQHMLNEAKSRGVSSLNGRVKGITACNHGFHVEAETPNGTLKIETGTFINAAGPFAKNIASMLNVDLPLECIYQQKIAFEDHLGAIPRSAPFTIDQDEGLLGWPDDTRALLAEDDEMARLADVRPSGVHVRPEGGDKSRWLKLGWATNKTAEEPVWEPSGPDMFPEIVMRGAARMVPELEAYCEAMPRSLVHYGGYYTRTRENWPLIGPMGTDGAFMIAGLSGYGSMTACAAGELCANWVTGTGKPDYAYASDFSLARTNDAELMRKISQIGDAGEL
jgi:glycine/D-amino acid oxidase-like deaminating enzyme